MRSLRWLVFGLMVLSLGGGLGASQDTGENNQGEQAHHDTGKKGARGNPHGTYTLKVTGRFSGIGTASVDTTVSLQVKVTDSGGTSGVLVADKLPVRGDYFKGKGTVFGSACTIEGRVDIASAQDQEETRKQAMTGRLTGTFVTVDGKVGRLVAVQSSKS